MYELYEDAASFSLGGVTVYLYGLFLALGAALMLVTLRLTGKKRGLFAGTAALYGALAIPMALLLARAVYCALDTNFSVVASLRAALLLNAGGYAMSGALAGAVLAALIAAKIQKTDVKTLLDALAPALLIFVLFERIGEGFTALGISRPLIYDTLKSTFLAQVDDYDAYLRTWLLEAAGAAVLAAVSLCMGKKEKRPGDTFLKTALLYCLAQVFFESLRYDQHLKYGFIGIQHILSMLCAALIVIRFAVRALKAGAKKPLPILSISILPVLVGLLVLLEFMIDRTSVNRFILYAVYALLLAVPGALGFHLAAVKGEKV